MAMVAVAIVAVLIAAIAEEATTKEVRRPIGPVVWVALGTNGEEVSAGGPIAPHWVDRLKQTLGDRVVAYDFAQGGCTAADVQRDSLEAAIAAQPDLITMWVGADDFLRGDDLGAFERRLWHVLSTLQTGGRRILVADIPDLSAMPSLSAEVGPGALSEELGHWNAAIARLTAAAGGILVSLDRSIASSPELYVDEGDRLVLTETGQHWIAERFGSALAATTGVADITGERGDTSRLVEAQPADPAAPADKGAN
jgi:hypothetical protein